MFIDQVGSASNVAAAVERGPAYHVDRRETARG